MSGSSPGTRPSTGACRPGRSPGSSGASRSSPSSSRIPAGSFASYVITPRGREPSRTIVYLHGGGFISPIDQFQVRYAIRLADAIGARVVMPDYPLAPERTWRDSFEPLVELTARWCDQPGGVVLAGDSAGGGYALALALGVRDLGGAQPTQLVLHAPWVDLTTSTPETDALDAVDPWLFIGKVRTYALWWAGSADDLDRPRGVSPLSPTSRGCRARSCSTAPATCWRPAADCSPAAPPRQAGTSPHVEEEGLLHVYPILPIIPEARRAFRQTLAFLR